MPRILVGLLACTGCDVVLGLDENPGAICGRPLLDDGFDAGPPCSPWGGATAQNATIETTGGEIVVTPDPAVMGGGGCTYNGTTPFGAGGVALEVTRVAERPAGFVTFQAFPRLAGPVSASILVANQQLQVRVEDVAIGTVSFDPVAMRWWRVRPDPDGRGVLAEVSADDRDYTTVALAPGTIPDEVRINFIAGTSPDAAPQATSFGAVRICALEVD